jgi:signal transduction histidine kinase
MKYFILFLFVVSISKTAFVQDRTTDSLKMLLGQQKEDTSKIQVLLSLADKFEERNRDSALYYAKQALERSVNNKHFKYQIQSLLLLNNLFREAGDYPRAIEFAFQSLRLSEQIKDTLMMYNSNRYLCFTYSHLNDFRTVLQYARKNKQLVNTGYFDNEKNSERYHFMGYISIMAGAFERLNILDSALSYRRLSYRVAGGDKVFLALASNGLAFIHSKLNNIDSAFMYFRQGSFYAKGLRQDLIAIAQLGIAKLYAQKQIKDSAIYYAKLSLQVSQNIKAPSHELSATSFLYELYSKISPVDSAYKYLALTIALKDSLYDYEAIKQVQNLGYTESLRQQQLEQARNEARQQYATKVRIYSLIAGLLVLIIVAFILYRNNKQKEKANLLLHHKQQELENTLEDLKNTQAQLIQREKLASLGELTAGIAHEIENPLNFVNNFSALNTELVEEMKQEMDKANYEEVKSIANVIQENELKISHHGQRADAIVKGMLEHSKATTGKKELTDINAIAEEYLRLSYLGLKAKSIAFNAAFKTDFDESIGKIQVVPQDIGRVLLNLYNNAFYSVTEKKNQQNGTFEPMISVSTKKIGNKVIICVKDNGMGIPNKVLDKIFQPFFTTKPTGQGTGLGLSLSYDIIKAHGGEIKVETNEGEGAEFTVQLSALKYFEI